jgi:hypothetical protein
LLWIAKTFARRGVISFQLYPTVLVWEAAVLRSPRRDGCAQQRCFLAIPFVSGFLTGSAPLERVVALTVTAAARQSLRMRTPRTSDVVAHPFWTCGRFCTCGPDPMRARTSSRGSGQQSTQVDRCTGWWRGHSAAAPPPRPAYGVHVHCRTLGSGNPAQTRPKSEAGRTLWGWLRVQIRMIGLGPGPFVLCTAIVLPVLGRLLAPVQIPWLICYHAMLKSSTGWRSVARRRIPADRGAGLLFLLACCALSNKAGFWYCAVHPRASIWVTSTQRSFSFCAIIAAVLLCLAGQWAVAAQCPQAAQPSPSPLLLQRSSYVLFQPIHHLR